MKQAGRMNPLIVVGILCLILLLPLLCVSQKGPENAAADFMSALGKGDAKTLASLSILGNMNEAQMQRAWEQTLNDAKYYRFTWRITDVSPVTNDTAAVTLQVRKDLELRLGQDEYPYQLPMKRVNGQWKVVVDQMPRDMYPFLPRP